MSTRLKDKIYDIAVNAFEVTCFMFSLEEQEIDEPPKISENIKRAAVDFNGAAEGRMVIHPSEELLTAVAANMLGVENPNEEEKSGALCEIANIICGNIVPLFADDDAICYVEPPIIIEENTAGLKDKGDKETERVQIYLDEGTVEISVYYSIEVKL
ncbi:chemotaxis protein CheX [Aliifodinibius salicampi]|uniref:Chemotaxis protein CheX n=1 Tax=Fodinibius salicampi TaxID=1920655 RepID=A0ABT3Q0K4_9BACT|nr:chemotaxis protein CheX [Fodinibius salicampi]MCW9713635.1 chemotaxis protein CheX [Fodinibius salicampi]